MFETEKEAIQAMIDNVGQEFKYAGGQRVCKFDPNAIRGSWEYSPFVWRPQVPNGEEQYSWRAMTDDWQHYREMHKVTTNLPDLPIDTQVFVKEVKKNDWLPRHFMKWDNNGDMVCFSNGDTSFTETNENGTSWKFWKVARR